MVRQIDISTTDPNSPELLLQHWQKAFINILDTVAPIRTFPMHRHRSPCLNAEIRELIRHRDFLAKQFKKNPGSSTLKEDLKLAQRRMKSRIRREAKEQATQALNSSNPVDAWNYIKRATLPLKEVKTLYHHLTLSTSILRQRCRLLRTLNSSFHQAAIIMTLFTSPN